MNILLVHNFYGSEAPSGENRVFELEKELLIKHGNNIITYERYSDEIRQAGIKGKIKGGVVTPWNFTSFHDVKKIAKSNSLDIVHVHNTFPLISPSIIHALKNSTPVVLTLHNYRLFCAAGIPMRAGEVCTKCIEDKSALPGLVHKCYRGQRLATLPLTINILMHRRLKTWTELVDGFIVFTEFQKSLVENAGVPGDKIYIKPNYYPGYPMVRSWEARENTIIYAGRLSEEKGAKDLISAWRIWGQSAPELKIYGDGELIEELCGLVRELDLSEKIKFYGKCSSEEVEAAIASSRMVIVPSICFEGFPMVVREAFAYGTPVAASNLGPLKSIVKDGVLGVNFMPGNAQSIFDRVSSVWNNSHKMEEYSVKCREEFELKYNENANYSNLMEIYHSVINKKAEKDRVI